MGNNIVNKYRIAISPTSKEDLEALRYAFEGRLTHGEHQDCPDDVLVATLLGWHFRKIGRHSSIFAKALAHEFSIRSHMMASGESSFYEKERARRQTFRGTPCTPGNILTIDGIDNRTLARIEARAHSVERMIEKLSQDHSHDAPITLMRYSDQAIIDLGVWWTLTWLQSDDYEVEPYPRWIKEEIRARGAVRAEYDEGGVEALIGDEPADPSLPALSPKDRRAFFIQRRINPQAGFWTDERIRRALGMGL